MNEKDNLISKVEVIPINETNLVAIVVTDKGHVEHRSVTLSEKVSIIEVKQTVDLINKFIVGTPIDEVSSKLEFEVKPHIAETVKQQKAVYDALYNVFNDLSSENSTIRVNKPSNILKEPEFYNNMDKIQSILEKVEDKDIIRNI